MGFIVIEQLPHDDCVLMLDGWPWRGPVALKARANVPAGRHRVECRNATGAATFTRELEVAAQRETPVYWGP